MLFQVEGTQVYFLASMHCLPENNNHISPTILRTYQQSEVCLFEDNHNKSNHPYPPEIQDDGTPQIWAKALCRINNIAKENNLIFSSGVESQLFSKAQNDQKKIDFLDIENCRNAYAYAPIKEQLSLLDFAENQPKEVVKFLHGIYTAWREWNAIALAEALEGQFTRFPEIYGRLHTARNQAWMPKILATITAGSPALIIAGAFHFVGTKGICQQAHQHGFNLLSLP